MPLAEIADAEIDDVLKRFDKTDPKLQRRIIVQLILDRADLAEELRGCYATVCDAVSLGRVRYKEDFPTCSPWTELAECEKSVSAALDATRWHLNPDGTLKDG
jgi:hypothetical protein